jgi:hypothetical protein
MIEQDCVCLNEPRHFEQYDRIKFLGVDETEGRFGEVSIWRCKRCSRYWLHYLVEYEAIAASGRYFMGLITQEKAETLAPNEAIDYLNGLGWHLYGGSFFGGKGRSAGKVDVDP